MITAPGIYTDISHLGYHSDPCPAPSLSHTLARLVIKRTPHHAMAHHPKLGGKDRKITRPLTIGNAAHSLVLGKGAELVVIEAENYKKKEPQEQRDAAIAKGLIPILRADYELAEAMVPAGRAALEEALGMKLELCLIEAVVAAQDPTTGCWRRIMVDAMTPNMKRLADYKTAEDAGPDAFERSVRYYGYDTQDAFYLHVLALAVGEDDRDYTIVAQEKEYPDVTTMNQIDGDLRAVATHRVGKAAARWDDCLRAGKWEAYPRTVNLVAARNYEIEEAMMEGAADV